MQATITITIDMDNAAFGDAPNYELARILRGLSNKLAYSSEFIDRPLFDINGNKVGKFELCQR